MIRHSTFPAMAFAACATLATTVAAQVAPPNIRGPIDAAKRVAGATSAQVERSQSVAGEVGRGALPAAAAQASPLASPRGSSGGVNQKMPEPPSRVGAGSGAKGTVLFYREEYSYSDGGRRDPFVSLMTTGALKPVLQDLVLIGVLYDQAQPDRSIAMLVDGTSGESYRVKAGNTLGRMKVVKVGEREITFSIDEFGFSRRETLPLDMTSRKTGAIPARRP